MCIHCDLDATTEKTFDGELLFLELPVETVLNLIEKQSKIIQTMANDIYIEIVKPDGEHFATEEEVIEYYSKKVDENENRII